MTYEEVKDCEKTSILVYLKKDIDIGKTTFFKGDIFKVVGICGDKCNIKIKQKAGLDYLIVHIDDVGLVEQKKGCLEIIGLGKGSCSIVAYNDTYDYDGKLKLGDKTNSFLCNNMSGFAIQCVWKRSWFTDIDLLRFIPNDEEEPKTKTDTEEQIPTLIKAVKQATGLSIGMTYTYTPTDTQNEFIGVIEGFMITKKGIFVVDYNGDIIPASKCKKAK